jgi:hypothetical protein
MSKEQPIQKTLRADDASIQERQVTVRVLTIGAKQVTQALYRQLVEEHAINQVTGELKGAIWGWVNLHDKDCGDGVHRHVIWEGNGQLKRSETKSSHKTGQWQMLQKDLHRRVAIYMGLVALDDKNFPGQKSKEKVFLTVKGRNVVVDVPYAVQHHWRDIEWMEKNRDTPEPCPPGYSSLKMYEQHRNEFKKGGLYEIFRNHSLSMEMDLSEYTSHHQVYQEMEKLASELNLLEENYTKSYKAIEDAGQLFIAVSGVWK